MQCGYCTPRHFDDTDPFFNKIPDPTEDEIRHALSGNLCRCTGYQHIVDAVSSPQKKCAMIRKLVAMISSSFINDLHSGALTFPEYLAQVEARYMERGEPSLQAFIPEEDRFRRLHKDADTLLTQLSRIETIVHNLFGVLAGVKDIFHVEGFTTQAGSRLPAEVLQGREAESVTRTQGSGRVDSRENGHNRICLFFTWSNAQSTQP